MFILTRFRFILLALCTISCGNHEKRSQGFAQPSFVSFHVRQVGVSLSDQNLGVLMESLIEVRECSRQEDNRTFVITHAAKAHIENLTQNSTGCKALLKSITFGGNQTPEVFIPKENTDPLTIRSTQWAEYVSQNKYSLIITSEAGLSESLGRIENVVLSIMPAKEPNTVPMSIVQRDFPKSSPFPAIVLASISNIGIINNKRTFAVYLACTKKMASLTCDGLNLSQLKLRVFEEPTSQLEYEYLYKRLQESSSLIVPNNSHLFLNGIRIIAATLTTDREIASIAISNNDTIRVFEFQLP